MEFIKKTPIRITASQPHRKTTPRPLGVTLLAVGVLIFSVLNLARLAVTLQDWQFWQEWLPIPAIYLAISGGVWFITWTPLAWGIWIGKAWAGRLTPVAALSYSIYTWLDRLLLKAGADNPNTIFAAGLTVLLLLFTYWNTQHGRARDYFGQDHPIIGE